jgi:hypothetical protein
MCHETLFHLTFLFNECKEMLLSHETSGKIVLFSESDFISNQSYLLSRENTLHYIVFTLFLMIDFLSVDF